MTSDETSQEIDMVIGSNEDEETSEDVADTTFTPVSSWEAKFG